MATFRGFFSQANFQPQAAASSYLEVQTPLESASTKVSCSVYGPMAKAASDGNVGQEDCHLKVSIDFNDSKICERLVLQQNSDVQELIEIQTETIRNETSSEFFKERKIQQIIGNLQQQVERILKGVVLVQKYAGFKLQFSFHVYEVDQDFLQAIVNSAAVALLNSGIECKGLPTAICMLLKSDRKQLLKKETLSSYVVVDPSVAELKIKDQYSHKIQIVGLRGNSELLHTAILPQGKGQPLDLADLELIVGLGLSLINEIHQYIIKNNS